MNVLSLFDGMSCGQIALNKANIKYDKYFASEIDKHSIGVTQHNYPNTIQLGNVINIDSNKLPKIDLLIGGSPCTNFSIAGKKNGMVTTDNIEITTLEQYLECKTNGVQFSGQSYLFWEYIRLLKELKPKYFILENVKMKAQWSDIITQNIGVDYVNINSNCFSAQNRNRYYWTNIPLDDYSDKNISLSDILLNQINPNVKPIYNLLKDYNKGDEVIMDDMVLLTANNGKRIEIDLTKNVPYTFYETRTDEGKRLRKENRILTGKDSTPRNKEHKLYKPLKGNKANCLVTIKSALDYIVDNNWEYRILSINEMENMQTVPIDYTEIASYNQRRKMLGNGWTVDVIAHLMKNIK